MKHEWMTIKEFTDKYKFHRQSLYRLFRKGYLKREYQVVDGVLCVFYKVVKTWCKPNQPPFIEGYVSQVDFKQWSMKNVDTSERFKIGRYIYFKLKA